MQILKNSRDLICLNSGLAYNFSRNTERLPTTLQGACLASFSKDGDFLRHFALKFDISDVSLSVNVMMIGQR